MANLATIEDVEARLGRSLTETETTRVEALLSDASSLVVGYTGQKFLPGTSTNMLLVRAGKILLQQNPVTDVLDVTDIDGNDLVYKWDNYRTIRIGGWAVPNNSPVLVTYEHGSDTVPEDVVSVVAGLALRTFQIAPEAAMGITQQTTGPFSASYATWAVGGQVVLSPTDVAILDKYRIRVTNSIDTLG